MLHLRQVFERCRKYSLRINLSKYAFGVSSGKFLGFLIHLDLTIAKAIAAFTLLATLKELRSFVGNVSYLMIGQECIDPL